MGRKVRQRMHGERLTMIPRQQRHPQPQRVIQRDQTRGVGEVEDFFEFCEDGLGGEGMSGGVEKWRDE